MENKKLQAVLIVSAGVGISASAIYLYKKRQKNKWVLVPAEKEEENTLFNSSLQPREKFIISEDDYLTAVSSPVEEVISVVHDIPDDDDLAVNNVFSAELPPKFVRAVVVNNVFSAELPSWDWDSQEANRGPKDPYVIHYEEFINAEAEGFRQETLIWYAGDDVLADQLDEPIANYRTLTGELDWGLGSNDPNIVYIRNPRIKIEWEIVRHTGHFAIEVLGNSIEEDDTLSHSVLRFRDRD